MAFTEAHEDPVSVVYLAVQVALRDALSERDAEVLVRATRGEVTEWLGAAARTTAVRAETAAMRSLANAAKLLDDHPALARLKLVQALPPGAKVVLEQPPS